MAGVVHIPWYATGFRGDSLEAELQRVAPLATRYGATSYDVYRSRDDRYTHMCGPSRTSLAQVLRKRLTYEKLRWTSFHVLWRHCGAFVRDFRPCSCHWRLL